MTSVKTINIVFCTDRYKAADLLNPKINKLVIEENERREQVYNIAKTGKGTSVEKMPEDLRNGTVGFGVTTLSGERAESAFKHTDFVTTDDEKERYKKSHKNYAVGEQVKRNYEWNIDPSSTTFGKIVEGEVNGVSNAVTSWNSNQPSKPRKSTYRDDDLSLPPLQDMTFGVKTEKFDNATEVLKSWPQDTEKKSSSPKQQSRPDGSPFGKVESKIAPGTSPVASKTRGIYEEDWSKSRSKEELWDIIQGAKVRASRELFEEAYSIAVQKFKVPSVENVWKTLSEVQLKQFIGDVTNFGYQNLCEFEPFAMEETDFKDAADYLTKQGGKLKLNDQNRLDFYGLFKQATVGDNTTSKPGFFEMTARAKWDAWNSLKGVNKEDAMQKYIDLVTKFAPNWRSETNDPSESATPSSNSSGGTGPVFSRLQSSASDIVPEEKRDIPYYASTGHIDKVIELAKTADINSLDEEGRAAIHYACDRGNMKLLHELIRLKANLDLKDSEGQTALHYAASLEHVDIVKLLLEAGAKTNIEDDDGSTPLDVAEGEAKEILRKQ